MPNYYVLRNKDTGKYVYTLTPLKFTDLSNIALLIKEEDIKKHNYPTLELKKYLL